MFSTAARLESDSSTVKIKKDASRSSLTSLSLETVLQSKQFSSPISLYAASYLVKYPKMDAIYRPHLIPTVSPKYAI